MDGPVPQPPGCGKVSAARPGCQVHDQAPGPQGCQHGFRQNRGRDGVHHRVKGRSSLFQPGQIHRPQAETLRQCPLGRPPRGHRHLCAQCRHYCPTKAVTLTNDWHSAHRATEKYTQITRAKVKYDYCAVCGAKMRVLPQEVLNRIYAKHSEVDVDVISHLCPNCRRIDVAVEEDRACHIDQLEKMAAREEVCLVPPRKAEKASADKENAKEAPAQAASAPKTAAPSREATAQPKSDPAASKAAPSAQTPPAEQAASAAAETRPDTPSGTESAAEKPSPAAGNTAD